MHFNPLDDPEFMKELDVIPDYNTYLNDLQSLRREKTVILSLKQIRSLFFDKARLLPYNMAAIPPETINALTAFRVRCNVNANEDLSRVKTFSYPDPQFCLQNGRANIAGRTVLYCADQPVTALRESKMKPVILVTLVSGKYNAIEIAITPHFSRRICLQKIRGQGQPRGFTSLCSSI